MDGETVKQVYCDERKSHSLGINPQVLAPSYLFFFFKVVFSMPI